MKIDGNVKIFSDLSNVLTILATTIDDQVNANEEMLIKQDTQ